MDTTIDRVSFGDTLSNYKIMSGRERNQISLQCDRACSRYIFSLGWSDKHPLPPALKQTKWRCIHKFIRCVKITSVRPPSNFPSEMDLTRRTIWFKKKTQTNQDEKGFPYHQREKIKLLTLSQKAKEKTTTFQQKIQHENIIYSLIAHYDVKSLNYSLRQASGRTDSRTIGQIYWTYLTKENIIIISTKNIATSSLCHQRRKVHQRPTNKTNLL